MRIFISEMKTDGAAEFTNCISVEKYDPTNKSLRYDIK